MPKLQFKRTPEEEAARQRKKQKKEERRKKSRGNEEEAESSTRKRRRTEAREDEFRAEWANDDPSGSHWDNLLSQVEEELFREKMFDELEEERLDSIEARFNDYAHIPNRWKRGSSNRMGIFAFEEPFGMTDCMCGDPLLMDDDEYAEWIRTGMYRLKHADEYAEQQRKKAIYEARKAEEKAQKKEAARLEKATEDERKRKKEARERRWWIRAKDCYDQRWKELLSGESHDQLRFCDIPWPVVNAYPPETKPATTPQAISVCLEDLTEDAISKFLFPVSSQVADMKLRRKKLREALRRFHPDKFEGRLMKDVKESERARVREGIAAVIRVLNRLTEKGQ
ncbi:hypothetical protein JOM56_002508 [Amanita muscaria]